MDQRVANRSGSGGDITGALCAVRTRRRLSHGPPLGITLSVDECGPQPAKTLKFWKSNARFIEIGRRSAQAKGNEDSERQALFRCPVISRRHAKITFSEFGNVRPLIPSVCDSLSNMQFRYT